MKVLLDECIDRRLARELPGHLVRTVPQMGWATIKNGKLLKLAEQEFDVFVTVDRNLSFQQPLAKFGIRKICAALIGSPQAIEYFKRLGNDGGRAVTYSPLCR